MVSVLLLGAEFAAFLGVAVLVIVTPGQDTALTIRNSLLGGRRDGVFTALGVGDRSRRGLPHLSRCPVVVVGRAANAEIQRLDSLLTAYAFAVAKAGNFLRRTGIRQIIDAVIGVVLAGLGIRLATDAR